jgi:hypothetical protein
MVVERHGLGQRWQGGGSNHLSSMGRSSGHENEGINADLEAVKQGHGVVLFYMPGEGAGWMGGEGGSAVGGE